MNMSYVRLAKGLVNQTSTLIPTSANIYDIIKENPTIDFYVSLYRYEDRHMEHFKNTRSVAGIKDVTTPKILFDFDDAQNIEQARKDALEVCARLVKMGVKENDLRIFFSGNKGFNVELMTDQSLTRQEFVNIVFNLAGDLKTFDTRINDENRIIRAPLTRHPKSGLHKIPLTLAELATGTMEEISSLAIDPGAYESADLDDGLYIMTMPEKLNSLRTKEYKKVTSTSEIKSDLKFDLKDIDFSKCPKWLAKERYALQEGFFYGSETVDKGERNTAFMILGATYKNQGFSSDHTLGLLVTVSEKQAQRSGEQPYTEDQLRREVINTVFNPAWKGGIYGKDEELLVLTRRRFDIDDEQLNEVSNLVGIDNVGFEFKDFAKNIDQNTVKTGIKPIDDNVLITSGMMVALLAAPGAGKTSFANTFVEHLSMQGENTAYFSLDMYKNLLFSRLLQRYSGYDMRTILDMYKEDKPDNVLIKAYSDVVQNYSNVYFNFRSGPTVEEIEQELINQQQRTGKPTKLVVIDYLEKVRGPFSDSTANSAYIASRLSDIAKKHHTVVLLLVQPQKSAGDPREELTSYRKIKGASVIEQDSRVILTLTRPGYDPKNMDNDKYATISVVKNNMGTLSQIDLGWDGVSGSLTPLDLDAKRELKQLRQQLEEAKAVQKNGWDI